MATGNPLHRNIAVGKESRERAFYTVPEAARILGVAASTIWRWIQAGRLPAYRVGPRNIRIKKEDLAIPIAPAGGKPLTSKEEPAGLWKGNDPERVREVLRETAGSWSDVDADALIAQIYRAREEGSRPPGRP